MLRRSLVLLLSALSLASLPGQDAGANAGASATPGTSAAPATVPTVPARNLPPGLAEILAPEDPPSYLDLSIDDTKIDIFLYGEWISTLGLSFGLVIDPASGTSADLPLPEFPSVPFKNTVDLLLSLWLDEQFFIDLSFKDGFSDNRFLAGFSSVDPDFWFQKLWLGNRSIGIGLDPVLQTSFPRDFSPGFRAEFLSQAGTHEVFARLDSRVTDDRLFLGTTEITQSAVAAASPVRGKYFQLPFSVDSADLAGFAVWVESAGPGSVLWTDGADDGGRSLRFRRLQPGSEYSLNPATGTLSLAEASAGAVLVEFGSLEGEDFPVLEVEPVTDTNKLLLKETEVAFDPEDANFETYVLDRLDAVENPDGRLGTPTGIDRLVFSEGGGSNALLVYDPGRFSPFENLSYYRVPARVSGVQPVYYLPDPTGFFSFAGGTRGGRLFALPAEDGAAGIVRVLVDPESGPEPWLERWPLMSLARANSAEYFPTNGTAGTLLVAQATGPDTGKIMLGGGLDRTAIQVFRGLSLTNPAGGARSGAWTYDPDSGELSLSPPPAPDELVRVSIFSSGLPGSGFAGLGDIFAAGTQHSFELSPDGTSSLTVALDGSYPLSPDQDELGSGAASLRAALRFLSEQPDFRIEVGLDAAVTNPNPFGAWHQLRSGRVQQNIVQDPNWVLLGGVPLAESFAAPINAAGGETPDAAADEFSNATRAAILWSDSWAGNIANPLPRGILSEALGPTDAASIAAAPVSATSLAGPVPVLGSSSAATAYTGLGYRADIQFAGSETWASFQIPIALQAEFPPLPESISFFAGPVAAESISDNHKIDIYLQIGLLGEDQDADGQLDGSTAAGPAVEVGGRTTQTSGYDWLREFRSGLSSSHPAEDLDGDGLLRQVDGTAATWFLGTFGESDSGRRYSLALPANIRHLVAQAASRSGSTWLSRAQLRLVVVRYVDEQEEPVEPSAAAITIGQILLDYPSLPIVAAPGAGQVEVSAGPPPGAGSPPDVYNGLPGGDPGSNVGWTLAWDGDGSEEETIVATGFTLANQAEYGEILLVYYYDGGYDISISEPSGKTIDVPMSTMPGLTNPGWYVLRVDLVAWRWAVFDKAGFAGGAKEGSALVSGTHSFPPGPGSLTVAVQGPDDAGLLHIRKLVSASPILRFGSDAWVDSTFAFPDLYVGVDDFAFFAAPAFRTRAELGLSSRSHTGVSAGTISTSGSFVLLSANVSTYLDIDLLSASAVRAAGHSLRAGPAWLSIHDYFDWSPSAAGRQLRHRTGLVLGSPDSFSLDPELGLTLSPAGLARSLDIGMQARFSESDFTWSSKLSLGLEVSSLPLSGLLPAVADNYPVDWAQSFALWDFEPRSATDARSYKFQLAQSFGPGTGSGAGGGSATRGPELSMNYLLAPRFPNNSALAELVAGQEIRFATALDGDQGSRGDATLALEYRRSSVSNLAAGSAGFPNIGNDVETLGRAIGQYPLAAVSIPLVDLFLPWNAELWDGAGDYASTSQSAGLSGTISRRSLGQVSDLWLPSSVRVAMLRQTASPGRVPQDVLSFGASVALTPINMFGSQGILGQGGDSGFLSDEYLLRLAYGAAIAPGKFDLFSTARLQVSAAFLGIGLDTAASAQADRDVTAFLPGFFRNRLRVSNTFAVAANPAGGLSDKLSLDFTWATDLPPAPADLPGLREGKTWHLVHVDSLGLELTAAVAALRLPADEQAKAWFSKGGSGSYGGATWSGYGSGSAFADLAQLSVTGDSFSLFLSHASLLILPETGYVRVFVDLGVKLPGPGFTDSVTHLGGRLGAELLLSF